ncbi:MAG TPA: DUF1460 domain-containing protein [Candidatus Kapabacteria bacterium]|nr:DUF1460 domain-containing protein [Candidatus Kapabacteria bacterium]
MNRRTLIKNSLIVSVSFCSLNTMLAKTLVDDSAILFDIIVDKSVKNNWHKLSINEVIIQVAKEFIATPYVGGTLDVNNSEKCIINLKGLDCVTFFENSLAFARIIKKGKLNIKDLYEELTFTRYRDGELGDYTSRLHYTSDWIIDNIKKNVVIDKTEIIGGLEFHPNVFFMSKYPEKYKQLKDAPELVKTIKEIEGKINKSTLYYLPTSDISNATSLIESGDILALATNIPGLDYSHTGLAYRDDKNRLRFFHASSAKKEVLIDVELSEYLSNKKKDIGITVLKAIEPKA